MINYDKTYFSNQLITYIGNKRKLLSFINQGIDEIRTDLNREYLSIFDGFSGSGIVSRFFKEYIASELYVNDWEDYTLPINRCFLSNKSEIDTHLIKNIIKDLNSFDKNYKGIITENYAPRNDFEINKNERAFYTTKNAMIIDSIRFKIDEYPDEIKPFLLAPLLSKASIHVNTSGHFKSFHKNRMGIGQFGSSHKVDLHRIVKEICLEMPVLSDREIPYKIYKDDIKNVINQIPEVDVAYFDPPYNRHPYGSNYFMLNIITNNSISSEISKVSGIPIDWKKSDYNYYNESIKSMTELIEKTPAKYILISYNNKGIIPFNEFEIILKRFGDLRIMTKAYINYSGGRRSNEKPDHKKLNEILFILKVNEKWKTSQTIAKPLF